MTTIGLDIGGANLKASDGVHQTFFRPFPLWREPERLAAALRDLLKEFPRESALAVTMTGELADCFTTRALGVEWILEAVEAASAERSVAVWQTSGEFGSIDEARQFPNLVAAGNWHALATWAGRMAPQGTAVLIDIGSTTTDLIPLEQGLPMPIGRTDLERLASGELQYLGVRRTPVCSLISEIALRDTTFSLAREVFATSLDVHLRLGWIPEQPEDHNTANGKPATRGCAADRLARMLCSDQTELSEMEIDQIAAQTYQQQLNQIRSGLSRVLSSLDDLRCLLLAGEGEFLATEALKRLDLPPVEVISLGDALGEHHSRGACAFALARLASERM